MTAVLQPVHAQFPHYHGARRASHSGSHAALTPSQQDVERARRNALDALTREAVGGDLSNAVESQRNSHARLKAELEMSHRHIDNLLGSTRARLSSLRLRTRYARNEHDALCSELADLHEALVSPVSTTGTPQDQTLHERLKAYQLRLRNLEKLERLFGLLGKAEEFNLIIKEQVKLPSLEMPRQTYIEFIEFANEMKKLGGDDHSGLAKSVDFVGEMAKDAWTALRKTSEARLIAALDAMGWPGTKGSFAKANLPLEYARSAAARQFRMAFLDCVATEKAHATSSQVTDNSPKVGLQQHIPVRLPIQALVQPLVLRFRYHFDGKRPTNRLDKPEWYFANILNALSDHIPFVRNEVQRLVDEADSHPGRLSNASRAEEIKMDTPATTDFITAMLRPLERKLRASIPQLLQLSVPNVLAHTIYQALQFDAALESMFGYQPINTHSYGSQGAWRGTADVILGDRAWFNSWKDAEKKFIDDRYYSIISSPDAWHIVEDDPSSVSTSISPLSALRPTNSASRIRDLFNQTTDRYRPLPQFEQQLPFLVDIQLPLLDSYMSRISSAIDAFESLAFGLMRAVPGSLANVAGEGATSTRLTQGLSGLQRLVRAGVSAAWMEHQCAQWAEDVSFLAMWENIRESARSDAAVRNACQRVLEYRPASMQADRQPSSGNSDLFGVWVEGFHALSQRVEDMIIKHIVREVTSELKGYIARRWEAFDDSDNDTPSVTTDLTAALTVFTALLSTLSDNVTAVQLSRLYRQVASQLQEYIITRALIPKVWSEAGARQFAYDAMFGWCAAAEKGLRSRVRRPENAFRRLLDAAAIISLPGAQSISAVKDAIPISRLVQAAWDDANDAAFLELLSKIGIKELTTRRDVKAILRKRPECWR